MDDMLSLPEPGSLTTGARLKARDGPGAILALPEDTMKEIIMSRLALGLALSALTGGCIALSCQEVGCNGTYALSFEADEWEEGAYALTVFLDGMESVDCVITLPLESASSCDGVSAVELADGILSVMVYTPMNEDLVEADIALSMDGTVLLEEVVEPAWGEPYWPNGQACDRGYGCLSASDAFSL